MSTNLNNSQKSLLRWIVNETWKGQLDENEIWFNWDSDGTSIMGYNGKVPEVKKITLDVLEKEGFLICQKCRNSYKCALLPKADKAVQNNFKTEEIVRNESSGKSIYNLHGNNSRININSSDSSINIIDKSIKDFFIDLRKTIEKEISSPEKEELLNKILELENAEGSGAFSKKYAEFMAIAANHTTVLTPYFPALVQFLNQY